MQILERVRRLVAQLAPAPVCDSCLASRLDQAEDDAMRAAVGELAGERDFARERDVCGLCGEHHPVIRKLR